jgi:outer membrane protein assembly factor BamB
MPAVDSDGFVYVGSRSGRVLAISASNGVVRWDTSLPGPMIASLHVSEVEDDRLVFVPSGGRIHALDPCHGAARWVAVGEGFLGGRPVADGQAVYASFGDGTLRAFDRDTGRERWSRSVVERQRRYSRLLYSAWAHRTLLLPGLVLTSTVEVATAHDRETGEVAWSLPGRFMYTAGALVHQGQGVVLADERGRVVLVEAGTGHVRWEARPGFPILDAAPVTCDGRVYVPGAGAQLAMLDLDTGEETARVQLGGTALVSTPVIVGNLLVAGGQDGRIRALLR